ncbi:MAG: F0F1 ATP synthase subunit epsilon [Ignavibacteriaceae bacterium]|nr:F0F1 ATP synthase subunit epsilon [Ignavibacteriaceae bacterium]
MDKTLNLEIITPAKIIYSGEVLSLTVPGVDGSFQVLHNHAPIISTFEIGLIKLETADGKKLYFSTSGGTVEVLENKILVLADSLEQVDQIDIKRAQDAYNRAKGRLSEKNNPDIDVSRAEAALARAMNRINLANKYAGIKTGD